jgi:hypothetical protein
VAMIIMDSNSRGDQTMIKIQDIEDFKTTSSNIKGVLDLSRIRISMIIQESPRDRIRTIMTILNTKIREVVHRHNIEDHPKIIINKGHRKITTNNNSLLEIITTRTMDIIEITIMALLHRISNTKEDHHNTTTNMTLGKIIKWTGVIKHKITTMALRLRISFLNNNPYRKRYKWKCLRIGNLETLLWLRTQQIQLVKE